MPPTKFKPRETVILPKVTVHFMWLPVALTSRRGKRKSVKVNKAEKHDLVHEHLCLSHIDSFSLAALAV